MKNLITNNPLVNKELIKNVKYVIKIVGYTDNLPESHYEDFIHSVQCMAIENGTGRHCEYYYEHDPEHWENAVKVLFDVHTV